MYIACACLRNVYIRLRVMKNTHLSLAYSNDNLPPQKLKDQSAQQENKYCGDPDQAFNSKLHREKRLIRLRREGGREKGTDQTAHRFFMPKKKISPYLSLSRIIMPLPLDQTAHRFFFMPKKYPPPPPPIPPKQQHTILLQPLRHGRAFFIF